jgi:hypothetical protein
MKNKLSDFNYKRNITSRNTLVFFSFTNNACIFKYGRLIESGVEGQKVTSHTWCLNTKDNANPRTLCVGIAFKEHWHYGGEMYKDLMEEHLVFDHK